MPPSANVPAGITTTVPAVPTTELIAALMLEAVTVVPLDTVLHWVVTHWVLLLGGVHGFAAVSPFGSVAGRPALDQSIARLVAKIPDQDCVCATVETHARMRRNRYCFTFLSSYCGGRFSVMMSTMGCTFAAAGSLNAMPTICAFPLAVVHTQDGAEA